MTEPRTSVLVVDDDVDACRNLADILEDVGYAAATAHDGPSALARVRSRRFDVALLDLKMPGMDGLELYREMKRLRPETVAIVISAHASGETARQARDAGVWRVLAKPIDPGRLMPLIDEALGQPLVLVVDDDPDLCATLWDLLRDRDFRVGLAREGREAEGLLRDESFRVVLIDMKLPGGDGGEVFRAVRRLSPDSRVVLVTGFAVELEELLRRVLAEGADAICYKPFDVPRLLDTVDRLAGGRGP